MATERLSDEQLHRLRSDYEMIGMDSWVAKAVTELQVRRRTDPDIRALIDIAMNSDGACVLCCVHDGDCLPQTESCRAALLAHFGLASDASEEEGPR